MCRHNRAASQLDVPVAIIDNVVSNFTQQPPANAAAAAGELRFAVIDYKYLLDRWNRYRAPAGQEKIKIDALLALQSGNLEKAWAMYLELPRPSPPTGFRIAG